MIHDECLASSAASDCEIDVVMKFRITLAVSLVLAAVCANTALALQVDPDRIHKLETKHYDVWVEGTPEETEQIGFVLEQAWNGFDAFFGLHPDPTKRLKLKLYATEAAFLDAAWSDGAIVPPQCRPAFWSDMSGAMYAYGSPSSYTTRKAILFVACLQFHALAKAKNKDLPREWYEAGLAHAFSRHTWDGKKLTLMTRPLVEPVDFPLRALKLIEDDPAGLPQLIDAEAPDPISCWAAIGLCIGAGHARYRAAFDKYALGATGSKLPGRDFLKTLGNPTALARELHAWLLDEQTPFEMVSAEWEDRGGRTLSGEAEVGKRALCILKSIEPDVIECTLGELPKLRARAGLVTGYFGPGDLVLISVVAPSVTIDVWMDFKLVHTDSIEIPGDHVKERRLKLTRKGPAAQIEIDGIPFAPRELPQGRNGFFVESIRADFRNVGWN